MPAVKLLYCRTLSWREPLSFISTPILCSAAWSKWSHVAVVLEDGANVIDATFTHGGVQKRALADVLAVSADHALREYEVPNPDAGFSFLEAQVGKPYDKWGVIGLGLHRDWQAPDAWWCSELAEAFLAACGLVRFIDGARRVTQQDSWKVAAGVVA